MRAWVYRTDTADPYGVHIFEENVNPPEPTRYQVLIKVDKVSVCGTDESLFKSQLKRVPDGIIPGHEFYGEIVELGTEVHNLKLGQKIAGESHYQVKGLSDQGIIGLWGPEERKGKCLPAINGAYAEYLAIPAECAHPVSGDQVSEGFWPSLFEAIGNDYFLIKRLQRIENVNRVGVFGCGPHGLFAQVFARHFEIPKIAAFEIDQFRRKFAEEMKIADRVFDPTEDMVSHVRDFTDGNLFDAAIDMVGKQGQGFISCCETTRDGGTIFLFGLFSDKFSIEGFQGNEIIFKMKTLAHKYKGKTLTIEGITGREGIWDEMIETVCRRRDLQEQLMKPVRVMGTLDQLGQDTRMPHPGVLKRAYHAFRK